MVEDKEYSILIKGVDELSFRSSFKSIDMDNFDYSKIDISAIIGHSNIDEEDKEHYYVLNIVFDYKLPTDELEEIASIEVAFIFEKKFSKSNKDYNTDYLIARNNKIFLDNDSNTIDDRDTLSDELSKIFFSIAYGCIRGMLVIKSNSLPINLILPVIDFDKTMKGTVEG